MYTIKCAFCPDYYNSSESHDCLNKDEEMFKAGDKVKTLRILYGAGISAPYPVGTYFKISGKNTLLHESGNTVHVRFDKKTIQKLHQPKIKKPSLEALHKAQETIQKLYDKEPTEELLEDMKELLTVTDETAAKPTRYNKGSLEVWDAIEKLQFNYMQGNVVKYISRYKDKNGPEDLVKAINYLIKMIAQETGEDYYELHKLTPEELAKRIKK